MAKLAIIFGAGAAYDFLPTYPTAHSSRHFVDESRIPLANDLFQKRKTFADLASELPRLLPILPQLRTRAGNKSIEEVLEELRSIDRKEAYWLKDNVS